MDNPFFFCYLINATKLRNKQQYYQRGPFFEDNKHINFFWRVEQCIGYGWASLKSNQYGQAKKMKFTAYSSVILSFG